MFCGLDNPLSGQNLNDNAGGALLIGVGYAVQWPGGDLNERFGRNNNINIGVDYITNGSNWIVGIEGGLLFGAEVMEDPLVNLRTEQGFVIGNDRDPADLQLRERAILVSAHLGKLIGLSAANPRSGLRLIIGGGLLQHKIRIQDDPMRQVAALADGYREGYDRLTNGLAITEFIGYQLLSRNREVNFRIGFELTQAFTQSRRSYDFDLMRADTERRTDLLYGIKAVWTLPLYIGENAGNIYY